MSNKNIYEILADVEKAKTRSDRKVVLLQNKSDVLLNVLQGAFHPDIQFVYKGELPPYKPSDSPPGMGYSNMTQVMDKVYIFTEGSKRVNPNLPPTRREMILIQLLESLEAKEAKVFENMMLKDLKIKGLDAELVKETFPGLIP